MRNRLGGVGVFLDVVLEDLLEEHLHAGVRLLHRDARLQAREDVHPAALPFVEVVPGRRHLRLHHDRHVDVRRAADVDAGEPGRGDADDRHRVAVERDRLVEDGRIAPEASRPVAVAEDGDGVRPRRRVVRLREQAPEVRPRAEDVEEIARDELACHALRPPLPRDGRRDRRAREHAAEHFVAVAEVLIHRIRERPVVHRPAAERARVVELDELLGVFHGQASQEDLIQQREDGGVRADAERQRADDDGREPGRPGQGPNGVADVAPERGHIAPPRVCPAASKQRAERSEAW